MDEKQFFVRVQGRVTGPFGFEQLKSLRDRGQFRRFHEISGDKKTWLPASTMSELFPESENRSGKLREAPIAGPAAAPILQLAPAEPAASAPAPQWFYIDAEGNEKGPLTRDHLLNLWQMGTILHNTLVWKEGMPDWLEISTTVLGVPEKGDSQVDRSPTAEALMSFGTSEFITQNLMPGERVVSITRVHSLVIIGPGVVAGLGLLLIFFGVARGDWTAGLVCVGIPVALTGGIMLFITLVERLTTEISCTDRRILIKSGLLSTRLREMPLGKVESLMVQQGLFGRLFGYGTLVFRGSGGTRRSCKDIENPFAFYKRVQEQVALSYRK